MSTCLTDLMQPHVSMPHVCVPHRSYPASRVHAPCPRASQIFGSVGRHRWLDGLRVGESAPQPGGAAEVSLPVGADGLVAQFTRSAAARAIDTHRVSNLLLVLRPKSRTSFEVGVCRGGAAMHSWVQITPCTPAPATPWTMRMRAPPLGTPHASVHA